MEKPPPSSVKMEVNLQSVDAMFATLISDGKHLREFLVDRLDSQDRVLDEIKAQATKTNGRVTALELFRTSAVAKIAGFILGVSMIGAALTWILEHVMKYLWP